MHSVYVILQTKIQMYIILNHPPPLEQISSSYQGEGGFSSKMLYNLISIKTIKYLSPRRGSVIRLEKCVLSGGGDLAWLNYSSDSLLIRGGI